MTNKHDVSDSDIEWFNKWCNRFEKDHGFKEVPPPKDAGAIVIFPDADGKVDMIEATKLLYGIWDNRGKLVSERIFIYRF